VKRSSILVGLVLALVLAGLAVAFFLNHQTPTATTASNPPSAAPGVTQPPPPTPPTAQPPAKAQAMVPTFDVVRIDGQGNTVIGGRASPGVRVKIFDNGKEIGEVKADPNSGEWVFVSDTPLPPGGRQLTLQAIAADGSITESTDKVVLAVPADHSAQTIAVRMSRGDQAKAAGGAAPGGAGNGQISLADVPKLMQGGQPLPGGKGLAIDAINYDEQGHVVIVGRATAGDSVSVLLDGKLIGTATVGSDGQWALTPTVVVGEGKHLVHADLHDPNGTVAMSVDRVFYRVEVAGMPDGLRVVVAPGNNLWVIASHTYGEGRMYTMIYDANKGQINNPNLIYPGQVFVLPKADKPAP